MNLENLTQFEKTGKIEKIVFTAEDIIRRYNIALSRFKNAKKLLMNNAGDESVFLYLLMPNCITHSGFYARRCWLCADIKPAEPQKAIMRPQ